MADFSRFDQRGYPTVSVRDGYRDWLPTYEDTVQDLMDHSLLERVRSVDWSAVDAAADLGCGTGRCAQWLKQRGVGEIDGVDLTEEMLDLARAKSLYRQLAVADVRASGLEEGGYPLVVSSLVDEHLPALEPFYAEAARLLGPWGHFVLIGYHPFFSMAYGMPTHFDHPDGHPVAIETHLHLASDHVAAASAAGLSLVEMHESRIDDAWIARKPKWAKLRDWPISYCKVWRLRSRP